MATRLSWIASASAACFYAVARLAAGRTPVQSNVAEALAVPTRELTAFLTARGLDRERFFAQLVPRAVTIESNRALAEATLVKLAGRDRAKADAERLAGLIGDCERAFFAAFPKLVDELELRSRPIRELWEGCGPGLLALVGRTTDRRVLVEDATVAPVLPYLGAGGLAFAPYNTLTIEAVLANPNAKLPETVRLAWLLAALNADLPDLTERLQPATAETVVQLAILPAVLDAAAEVELIRPADDLLATAATAWEVPLPAGSATLDIVTKWWQFTRTSGAAWPIALVGLERLLLPGEQGA